MPKKLAKEERIVVTYSELDAYRQCPLKWKWSYHDGWRKPVTVGSALSRGSLWHACLEIYYAWLKLHPRGNPQIIFRFIRQNLLVDPATGEQNEDQEKVEWMLLGHIECYGREEQWEMVEVEAAHRVRLGPPSSIFDLQFKIDLLIRERRTGNLFLVDHKSASSFSRQTEIDVDDQFGLYSWGLQQLGYKVMGVIRSDARTQRNKGPMTLDQRFRRVYTFRTAKELQRIAADAYDCARNAYSDGNVIYSAPAPDRCSWRCDYLQAHLMFRKGFDETQTLSDFGFEITKNKHQEYATNPLLDQLPA